MAAFFIDLDGTVLQYHTSEFLPGVVEQLTQLAAAGHQIVFISMRGSQDVGTPWSIEQTVTALKGLPFAYIFHGGVASPRILIDDSRPSAVWAETNVPLSWLSRLTSPT